MSGENQKTILLVEDEVVIAMVEKFTIEKFGYDVITANTGEEAVDTVEKTPSIDLILMDIDLGAGMDGTEAAAIILRQRDLPVIFLSSHAEPEIVKKTEKITSYGYIIKSSSNTVLDASIKMAFKLFEAKTKAQEKEAALRESEASYRMLFSGASDGILLAESQTKQFRYANPAICRMMGYTEEEFLRISVADIHPKESLEHVLAEFESLARGEIKSSPDLPCLRKDGTIFYADISHSAMVLEGREYQTGFFHDITERKQAEEAIFQSKKDWEDCFDSITDMITIHDNDYNIIRANKAGKALLKLPALEEHLKLKCFSFYHGTDAPPAGCPSCNCLKSGIQGVFELFEPYLNRYLEIRALPRFDSNNQRAGLIHIVRDITERKRAEELLAIQTRIANIFGTMPDEEMFNEVLKVILDVMASPFGVFGYLDENGDWVVPTMTRQVWDKCQISDKTIRFPQETWGDGTWPRAIREKRTIHSNEPSANIPEGHVGIQRHISMPILFKGEAIGIFQVANKATDYTEADIRTLAEITGHIAPLLSARLMRERAQEALQVNEKKLKEALVLGQIGNWEYDIKNQKLTWSDQVYKLYERDPVLGPPTVEEEAVYYSPEQAQTLRGYTRNAIETGQFFEYDLQATLPSGKQVYLTARIRPIKDAQGHVIKLFGIMQGITERKRAEETLRYQNEMRQIILDNIPVMVAFFDREGHYQFINHCWQSTFGWSLEEAMHKDILAEIYPHPEYREYALNYIKKAAGSWSDFKTRTRNGRVLDTSWINVPLSDGSNIGIGLDITERKRAEKMLESQHALLKALINSARDTIIFSLDRDYCYTVFNEKHREEMKRVWNADIKIGMNLLDCMQMSELRELAKQSIDRALKGEVFSEIQHQPEPDIYYEFSWNPIWQNKEVVGVTVLIKDITERKRAEKEKEQIISLQRATIESTADGILVIDHSGKITDFNQRFAQMWRIPDSVLAARDDAQTLNFVLEQLLDPQGFMAKVQKLYAAPDQESFDLLQFKDGRCFERYSGPQRISGQPVGRVWSFRDITERKRAESQREAALEALRKSEGKYRSLTENINLGIYRNTVGPEGKFIEANPAIIGMFGYKSKEEFLAINVSDLYQNPEDRNKFNDKMHKEGFVRGEELWLKKKDGSPLIGSVSEVVVKDEQGHVKYYDGIIDNITERKRAEFQREAALAALRESEEKYRTLFTSSSDAIMLIEPLSGKFISGNQTMMEMFELKNDDDFSSFGPWNFSPERQPDGRASAEKAKEMNEIAMRNGSNFFEWAHKRLNSEEFSANVRLTRMVLDKKTILQATVRDITEHKRAEEEIKRQLAEKEILLREVHHRIKNNMASVGSLLSLHSQSITNPEAIAVLQDAIGRVNSMRILYDKLLLSECYTDISVKNYLDDLIDTIIAIFPNHAKIIFEKHIDDFHLDAKRLFPLGIITNELLTNIMKYAFSNGDTGLIKISLANVDNHVTFTIQDNGKGLPAGFDINASEGFGLKLVKMLSQQLGGSFSIENHAGNRCMIEFNI